MAMNNIVRTLALSPRIRQGTAVPVERGDTDQGGKLLVGQFSRFRQVGQQGIGHLCPDSRGREQNVTFLTPFIHLLHEFGDEAVELLDLGLDVADMTADVGAKKLGHDIEAIFLHGGHLHELEASGNHILIFRIFPIASGHTSGGIAADLEGLADVDGKTALGGSEYEVILSSPCGLDHDTGNGIACQAVEQFANPLGIIGETEMAVSLMDSDIQLMLADIDADIDVVFPVYESLLIDLVLAKFGLKIPFDCSK